MAILAFCLVSAAWAIDSEPAFKDPAQQARYERLAGELRCLVCQNETIKDSNAGLAADLRRELREQMQAGKSDEEIMQFLTARYGDFVRYRPPLAARTVLLWATPILLLIVAIAAAAAVIVRRSRMPHGDDRDDGSGDETGGDSADVARNSLT